MKKNNKFRNNGNSNAYSLNYKFDSISPAGKISGTALDLIKKYNELAKEAHGSGDYIEMEVYRQYAEHYRKIVTEINERKNSRQESQTVSESQTDNDSNSENSESQNNQDNNLEVKENISNEVTPIEPVVQTPMPIKKKSFKIVEITTPTEKLSDETNKKAEKTEKLKRTTRRKKTENSEATPSEAV